MDKLRIDGLDVAALIGVHAWERQVRQRLSVDLELDVDARRATATDELAGALDYGSIARYVNALVDASRCRLIETLAELIAQGLLDQLPVRRVSVTVHKPTAVPNARDVSIEIERER